MVSNSARKKAARQRMDATGEKYTAAVRAVTPNAPDALAEAITWPAGVPRWRRWTAAEWPALACTYRDGDQRMVEILDVATGAVLNWCAVPWEDPDALEAEYDEAGLLTFFYDHEQADKAPRMRPGAIGTQGMPGSMAWREKHDKIRAGRPDLLVHRFGYRSLGAWHEWPDGSWRSQVEPIDRTHTVTVTPTRPDGSRVRIVVQAQPSGAAVVDAEVVVTAWTDNGYDRTQQIREVLNGHGFTVDRWGFEELPGGVQHAPARVGRLAERDWWTEARVRVTTETTTGSPEGQDQTYRVGQELTMLQWGSAHDEVKRDAWWTNTDLDLANILRPDQVEVVEVLLDVPPFWDDAALSAEQVSALLGPHHPGAVDAAAAWAAAGLHVAHEQVALAIRTPAPEYRRIGIIERDYWAGNQLSKPYEAIVRDGKRWERVTRRLDALPLDPVTAAAG